MFSLLIGVGLAAVLAWIGKRGRSKRAQVRREPTSADVEAAVYKIANELKDFFENTSHPSELLRSDGFLAGVAVLHESDLSDDRLIGMSKSSSGLISCMALEALKRRDLSEKAVHRIARNVGAYFPWSIFFALRAVSQPDDRPVIGAILAQTQEWWLRNHYLPGFFDEFIRERLKNGEKLSFKNCLDGVNQRRSADMEAFLARLEKNQVEPLLEQISHRNRTLLDESFLNAIGRLWTNESFDDFIVPHDRLDEQVDLVHEILFTDPSRSVLIVGESGVGKTVAIKSLAGKLGKSGWSVFEAGAAEVMAGQSYIGQPEQRVRDLIKHLDRRRKVVWFIPNFHEIHYAARWRFNPVGILNMLLPFVDDGTIKVIGEIQPPAFERLIRENKKVGQSFEVFRIEPLDDTATLQLARTWMEKQLSGSGAEVGIDLDILREAQSLAKQYLSDQAAPGNLLGLLNLTRRGLAWDSSKPRAVTSDDFIMTLSRMTGLPASILDDREQLNLESLRDLFKQRILGQPEAVDCLVERVAMIKAGLCDPTRPTGVFLFAGPTGTGKTEIVKALADFLFGSSERMIRLDMSEFQTPGSSERIIGTPGMTVDEGLLTSQIRKQPFTVILLDEIEKSHPSIWNLFLQVFDDGRLTDAQGNTADFRHSIIIMTTNLGATIYADGGIGFNPSASAFSIKAVEQAVDKTFPRELVNRIDRIVIFHPLSRTTMRQILQNELNAILQRRGLRTKEWAVEWDDTATEFLLNTGFTVDLGARPLKRAIERYLLSPLAATIVNHQVPKGDQFLFIRSDGKRINVEFVDPDAPEPLSPAATGSEAPQRRAATGDLRALMLFQKGDLAEVESLQSAYEDLHSVVAGDEWKSKKNEALEKTYRSDFWESDGRFAVLGDIEYMDRIETGLDTAGSLLRRLIGPDGQERTAFSQMLVQRLAQRLYLLQLACRAYAESLPRDAYLKIEIISKSKRAADATGGYALQLRDMYLKWAKARRMRSSELRFDRGDTAAGNPFQCILAVSGFGAFLILSPENGLHVFEAPKSEKAFERYTVRVTVIAQPDAPPLDSETLLSQAEKSLREGSAASLDIVRYYRKAPSALVRDTKRRWRTGRLDLVLDGNFDLFGEAPASGPC